MQQNVTDSQGTSYDMFNVHAFSETWLKKDLFFSTGYSFANLNDDFSGSRIYGDDFGVAYSPNPANGLGYTSLNGGAHEQTHVGNVNLMATPIKNLTIVPSLRVESDTWDANSSGTGTFGTDTAAFQRQWQRGEAGRAGTSRCALHRRDQLGVFRRRRMDGRQWQPVPDKRP